MLDFLVAVCLLTKVTLKMFSYHITSITLNLINETLQTFQQENNNEKNPLLTAKNITRKL